MTPRRSAHADARARLRAAVRVVLNASPLPDPLSPFGLQRTSPLPQAGEGTERARTGREKETAEQHDDISWLPHTPTKLQQTSPSLTEAVRALYEDTVTPVAEIARLAGVGERTLYRYVERGGWTRRHPLRGREAGAANRGRKREPREPQARGAGGRFVSRAEVGAPHPSGLKALDPQGARRAVAACERWSGLAGAALAQAVARRDVERDIRAFALLMRAFRDMAVVKENLAGRRPRPVAPRRAKPNKRAPWRPMVEP